MRTASLSDSARRVFWGPIAPGHTARNTLLGTVLLALITLLLYAPTATFSFVSYDDGLHLYNDPYMQNPSAATIARFWQSPYAHLYIPVAYSCWSAIRYAERHLFRSDTFHPQLYHAVNIALHLLNVILLFRILLLLGNMPYGAFAGALLFAIHPVQTESVAWISEMRGLVAAAFSFLAIHIALKSALQAEQNPGYSRNASLAAQGAAAASFTLALLAKPTVVVIPVMYAALCLLYRPKVIQRRMLSTALLWLCISVPITVATQTAQPPSPGGYVTPISRRPLVMLDTYGFYVTKLLLPIDCTIDYSRAPQTLLTTPTQYLGTALLAAAVALAVLVFRKRYPVLLPGAIVFLAGILPVSGIVPFHFQKLSTVADRYLYLPLVGIAIIVAAIPFTRLSRGVRIAMCSAALLIFLVSFSLAGTWRNDNALYTHAVKANPRSFMGLNNLAVTHARNGDLETAASLFRRALMTDPQNAGPYAGLAEIAAKQHRISTAIALLDSAIERAPEKAMYYQRRALLHRAHGDEAQTAADLMQAINIREAHSGE